MKVIRPAAINDARLVSSTVAETEHAAWSSGATYALGDRVIKAHRVWESAQAANTNHDPEAVGSTWWFDAGPSNRWAMFDNTVGTVTSATNTLTVELAPGRIDAVALLQVYAATARVEMLVDSVAVYDRTVSLIDDARISDWYMYFFEPIRPKDYALFDDIPVFGEGVVRITLTNPAGTVSVGVCAIGMQADLGDVMRSPGLGISDYSRKTTDDFGVTTLVQRSYAKRMGVRLIVDNADVDRIHSTLADLRALPAVWVGSGDYSSMLIFGFFRDFDIDIAYQNVSYCSLNIEGMI